MARRKSVALTDAELRIMRVLWDRERATVGEVVDGIDEPSKPAYTTETMKYYVDFAAKSGFEYMLVDAGWSDPKDITKMNGRVDIPGLVTYARAKGVKVWIWLSYRGVDSQMEEAFPLYEKWGVAGMKIDFIERDDQRGIDFYYRVAQAAAEHHLMVDFHGSTKPSGLERTYPNVLGDHDVADRFGLASLPVTLLIDRNGKVAAKHFGLVDKADVENEIRKLLKEHPKSTKKKKS